MDVSDIPDPPFGQMEVDDTSVTVYDTAATSDADNPIVFIRLWLVPPDSDTDHMVSDVPTTLHISNFFYELFESWEVEALARVRDKAAGAGRTAAGWAMQWIGEVARAIGVTSITLEDDWELSPQHPGGSTLTSRKLELDAQRVLEFASDPAPEAEAVRRRARRALGRDPNAGGITDNEWAYLQRLYEDGYYGGFGFVGMPGQGQARVVSVDRLITLASGFSDRAMV